MRALALLAVLAACAESATSIQLSVQMPEAAGIDELAIVVASQRSLAPAADQLTVFVPDDWAGAPIRLEVEGMASSTVVALGATDVMPVRGEEITALVQLVDKSCPTVCTPGDVRCEGDGIATCAMEGSCPAWSVPAACPSDAPFCSNGSCSATCSDECSGDALACDGMDKTRSCGNADADTCLDWVTTACGSNEVCTMGVCEPEDTPPVCPNTICAIDSIATNGLSAIASDGTYTYYVEADGVRRRHETTGVIEIVEGRTIDPSTVVGIGVDATHVYWTEGIGTIKRTPKAGGSIQTYYTNTEADVGYLAIDDTHVYWTENGFLRRRAKSGGTPQDLAFTATAQGRFAIDDTYVYYTDYETSSVGNLYRVKKDGSANAEHMLAERLWGVAVDSTHLYIMGESVGRLPKAGGNVDWLVTNVTGIHIAVDATHVVWMNDNALFMRNKATGDTVDLGTGVDESFLALSPTHVAWSAGSETSLEIAPRCACEQ